MMDMLKMVEICKEDDSMSTLNRLIEVGALDESELAQLFELAGMPNDTAEFLAEWYPELAISAWGDLYYTYFIDHDLRFYSNEDELRKMLEFLEVSEDEYQERYGVIIRDAAFDGVVVVGE